MLLDPIDIAGSQYHPAVRATVYSIYMPNVDSEVVRLQRLCVEKFLPDGWGFVQYLHLEYLEHPNALAKCLEDSPTDMVVFLDIDCIPLSTEGFAAMEAGVAQGKLVGAAQRATHLPTHGHIYVAPCCMAFSRAKHREVGSPSFFESWHVYEDEERKWRSDVAEELSYAWEENGPGIELFMPTHSETDQWELTDGIRYGIGTTYNDWFFHAFFSRSGKGNEVFRRKCEEVLGRASAANR
jgi:hypothetical protein